MNDFLIILIIYLFSINRNVKLDICTEDCTLVLNAKAFKKC